MPPAAVDWSVDDTTVADARTTLIDMASTEIEQIRVKGSSCYPSFPPACLALLKSIDGNHQCMDCDDGNPDWAAVRYGALVCLHCSGHHRSLGVQVSCVRSVTMDEWSSEYLLQMLEGGNTQLASFFSRHHLSVDSFPECPKGGAGSMSKDNVVKQRYKTRAAEFYRNQLVIHTSGVLAAGPYRGRDLSRSSHKSRNTRQQPMDRHNTTE